MSLTEKILILSWFFIGFGVAILYIRNEFKTTTKIYLGNLLLGILITISGLIAGFVLLLVFLDQHADYVIYQKKETT